MLKKYGHILLKVTGWTKKIHLPLMEGQSVYHVGKFFWQSLSSGAIGVRAASVSFRFLQALFPMIITMFSLIPFIPIQNFQQDILLNIESFFPKEVYTFIEPALLDLITMKRTVLLSIGFLITIYFASSGIDSLLLAFSQSKHFSKKRNFIKRKLWSFGVLFLILLLSVLVAGFSFFGNLIIDWLYSKEVITGNFAFVLIRILKILIEISLVYFTITMLFNIGDHETKRWQIFSAGATASTLLILLLQKFFSVYLTYFANFDKLYGPLGAIIAFLLFTYYVFYLLIIGFELNVSILTAARTGKKK